MNIEIDFKISESAVAEFKRILAEANDQESLVRVVVQSGGCSGSSYGLGFVPPSDVGESDIVGEYDGLKVVVDRSSLMALDGTVMEWAEESEEKGFKFTSKAPTACKKQCGCRK